MNTPSSFRANALVAGRLSALLVASLAGLALAACGADEESNPGADSDVVTPDAQGDGGTDASVPDPDGGNTGEDASTGVDTTPEVDTTTGEDATNVEDTTTAEDTIAPSDVVEGDTTTTDTTTESDVEADVELPEIAVTPAIFTWSGVQPPSWGGVTTFQVQSDATIVRSLSYAGTPEAPVGRGRTANLLGDFDGNGATDIAALSGFEPPTSFGSAFVHLTDSTVEAGSSWFAGTVESPLVLGQTANLVGDVNGDGRDDLIAWSGVTGGGSWGGINVYLSNGSGFEGRSSWFAGAPGTPTLFGSTANLAGDVNGDGLDDLIALSGAAPPSTWGGVQVYLSNGSGFDTPVSWFAGSPATPAIVGSTANLIGDMNGDGRDDVVAWSGAQPPNWGGINVYLSNLTAFQGPLLARAGAPTGPIAAGTSANLMGDMNGDGLEDLILVFGFEPGTPNYGFMSVMNSGGLDFRALSTVYSGTIENPVNPGDTGVGFGFIGVP